MATTARILTIGSLLAAQARLRPHQAAIEGTDQAPLTYADLAEQIEHTRRSLRGFGIGPQDRVALVLPDGPEAAVAFLAIAACAIAAPLNPACRASELAFYLRDLPARAVVVLAGFRGVVDDAARDVGVSVLEVVPRRDRAGAFDLHGPQHAGPARESRSQTPDSIALLLYTSGTTARPKLVPLTHGNLCTSANDTAAALELGPSDRCLHIVPHFHIHGLVGALLSPLAAGGTVICAPGFQAARVLDWIDRFAPTWYTAVPAMHQTIAERALQRRTPPIRSTLRFIRSVSAPLPRPLLARLETVFAVPVIEGYGMTEASPQISCNPLPPRARKPGSVGIAAGPEIAIMDDRGRTLGAHEIGEIAVRGANVMRGYERDPEGSDATFVNGWFHTGDQGYLDEDGYLFLTGRLTEVINRGGEKIAPADIEKALIDHPEVVEAAAFGVPDHRLGEAVAAAVVLRRGATASERQIREFVATRLAAFKIPSRIVFLKQLPKGPTGKVERKRLAIDECPTSDQQAVGQHTDPDRPLTPLEEELARLWAAALGVTTVGVNDDFFVLGGTSLSAVDLLLRIQQRFGVDLPTQLLFVRPTIAGLAAELERELGKTPKPPSGVIDVPPQGPTPTERRLTAIWEQVLGIRSIHVRDNFFDIGGQPHQIAPLLAEIQAVFGEGITARVLRETPTIQGLARLIDGSRWRESRLIVPLQPGGSRPPLFAIHAGAGYVFFYRTLASRLGGGVPVYAVQGEGRAIAGGRPYTPDKSVEQVAARYIREIKSVQAHGPYNFAGGSFGGIVAFEMARQLRAVGEDVNSLFLFSPHVRNNPHVRRGGTLEGSGDRTWSLRVRAHLAPLSTLEKGAAAKYVVAKIARWVLAAHQAVGRSFRRTVDEVRRELDWRWRVLRGRPIHVEEVNARFMKASRSLIARYRPGDYDGQAILFRAEMDEDPVPLWTGLALGGMEVHDTPGGHLDMLEEPTVGAVADLIRARLERADRQRDHVPEGTRAPSGSQVKTRRDPFFRPIDAQL